MCLLRQRLASDRGASGTKYNDIKTTLCKSQKIKTVTIRNE